MKLSIIVPVYNKVHYLERFISSIGPLDENEYEVICVDNNSTDGSYELLCKLSKKLPAIHVMSEEKQGTTFARFHGFQKAKGTYLLFLDPDDEVNRKALKKAVKTAYRYDADMLICDYQTHNPYEVIAKKGVPFLNDDTKEVEDFTNDVRKYLLIGAIWNKLIKKEKVKEKDFCFTNMGEDGALIANVFYRCNEIYYLKEELYHYYRNVDSITMNIDLIGLYHSLQSLGFIYEKLKEKEDYDTFQNEIEYFLEKMLLGSYVKLGYLNDRYEKRHLAHLIKEFYLKLDYRNNPYMKHESLFKIIQYFLLHDALRPVIYQDAVNKLSNKARVIAVDRHKPKVK